jgi:transcriptional regulator with XRE-family HTH domain
MTIGKRIKERRKELKISADELAEKLGKNRATIFRYEKGDIENLPLDILEPIAEILQTTPQYLMGWEEEKPPVNELSEDERRLIEIYRKISPEAGEMLLTMVNIFEEMPQDRAQMLLAMIRAGIENQG